MPSKKSKIKRIHFFNPITQNTQILELDPSYIKLSEDFPIPISIQEENQILTLFIDNKFKVRGIDVSKFYQSLINEKGSSASIIDCDEKELEEEAHFRIFKNKLIKEQQSKNTYGNLLIVGLSKAGKTSIVNRLKNNLYDPNIKPTLSTNIVKVFLEGMNFRIFDMGGQIKLREQWYKSIQHFEAIIFVLDVVQDEGGWNETVEEFQKIHKYYFNEGEAQTPLVIFGNKIDLVVEGDKKRKKILKNIINKLKLNTLPTNYHVELSSAKQNQGILPNFKWIVKNYIEIKKTLL